MKKILIGVTILAVGCLFLLAYARKDKEVMAQVDLKVELQKSIERGCE